MTQTARRIDAEERRARLGRRHRLGPHRAADLLTATRDVVCWHATDPSTVYLSAWARVDGFERADLERELYETRALVKRLAMRRTVFVFPRETLAAAQAAVGSRVARTERARLVKDVEAAGLHDDGDAWFDRAAAAVRAVLADGRELRSTELRDLLPELQGSILQGEGRSWGGPIANAPRVLNAMDAAGEIVRATNAGGWAVSRHRWAATAAWLGEQVPALAEEEGTRLLVEQWLRRFGPGTENDLKWWPGGTLTAVRRALADLDAVPVDLDGRVGWVLPDDLDPVEPTEPWAALLPPLDPTTMGWTDREWYLGDYKAMLFDSAGNGGASAWVDGRIVGGWRQRDSGEVELQLLEDVGAERRALLEAEAERLSAWFDGVRVLPRFPSPLSKLVAEGKVDV